MKVVLIALVLSTSLAAQAFTNQQITAAITLGSEAKQPRSYFIRSPGFVGSLYKPILGAFSTPFSRVADAAYVAKTLYQPFTAANITAEMTAQELHVYGFAQAHGASIANVQSILITKKGARDVADAIRPVRSEPLAVEFKNLFGLTASGVSMLAVFPIDVLKAGYEVHIIYDAGVHDGRADRFCRDCAVAFDLKGVR